MANLIDDKTKKELKSILEKLPGEVRLLFFTQQNACPMCAEQQKILETLASLSKKIVLEVHDFLKKADVAAQFGIDKLPATVVMGKKDHGIRFYGVAGGYEFSSLLETILMVSSGRSGLSPQLEQAVAAIDVPVHLQVMTTMTCPYCPKAVHAAYQMAMANDRIRADAVEMGEFPTLVQRYQVGGVPRTVVNEEHFFEGAMPPNDAYLEVLKAVKPAEYQRIEEALREAQGRRNVTKPEEGHLYEIVIVGGGPAAMSAAVYAARKDLDVLFVAKELGGQITFTASIDNFLGMAGFGGKDMAKLFRDHMELFAVAEATGQGVTLVEKAGERFAVTLEDGKRYEGSAVIWCAGKEYARLGIPGEERFIGRGVAFCATCDAPLYRGRRVAVVGGGNSAFTAVRDLMSFATEIHLIHRRGEFTADAALMGEVLKSGKVRVHRSTVVMEILGQERLTGVRLVHLEAGEPEDLPLDGVFLEIGLAPNSAPVKELLPLNEKGEIPVTKENATSLPGFYAAGDVTDVREKQIAVAVGDGAKAALAAHRWLLEQALTRSLVSAGDTWQ